MRELMEELGVWMKRKMTERTNKELKEWTSKRIKIEEFTIWIRHWKVIE